MTDGTVYGTGQNEYGQLGLGENIEDSLGRLRKINVSGILAIITGAYTSIFQVDTITLYGCGLNSNGELAMGDTVNRYKPVQLLYTDIWLDELSEDIIIKPPADMNRQILLADGLITSCHGNNIIVLDKDLILHSYNNETLTEEDTIYFYLYKGQLKYTRSMNIAYTIGNPPTTPHKRKFTIDSKWEAIIEPYNEFYEGVIFSINNIVYFYNPSNKAIRKLYEFKDIVTSITNYHGNQFKGTIGSNKGNAKIIFAVDNDTKLYGISTSTDKNTFTIDSIDSNLSFKFGTESDIPAGVFDLTYIENMNEGTNNIHDTSYNKTVSSSTKKAVMYGFKDTKLYVYFLNKTSSTGSVKYYDFGEKITASTYYNKRIFVGTRSGGFYVIDNVSQIGTSKFKVDVFRKFRGEIANLSIKDTGNVLDKSLVIDESSRYIHISFTDGRYRRYPLYKSPNVTFKCNGINFINDKIYYHIYFKLQDYDPLFYNNMKLLIHNIYNEKELTLQEIYDSDKNVYELTTTVEFDDVSTDIYSFIRMNYLYGNNSLGSVYVRMGIIKANSLFYRNHRIIGIISNYSNYRCNLILEAVKINKDTNTIEDTVQIGTETLTNATDSAFVKFTDDNKYFFNNGYNYFNLYAVNGTSKFDLYINEPIENILYLEKVEETNYDGEISANLNIIFNKIYEDKNLDNISLDRLVNTMNLLSRKKLEYVNLKGNELLSNDVIDDSYGNTIYFLNDNKTHYQSIINPDKVHYRERYRSNIYINGLKVPFDETYSINDMDNNFFTTYYLDESVQKQVKDYTNHSLYQESLILSEKELWSYTITKYDNDTDRLFTDDGLEVFINKYDETLDESYLSVYIQFNHTVFWSRINTSEYVLQILERTDSYVRLKLKLNNQVLIQIGNTIHICVNDLDKKNSVIFRDTAKNNGSLAYKNYFTPLVYINETGSLYTYYTEKSENIEVYVDGFLLTPYVDYKVINLPMHLKVPSIVLFRNPIKCDKKIEISILKENFIDCIILKKKDNEVLLDSQNDIHTGTNFIPLSYNTYDLYLDGVKIPRLYEDGRFVKTGDYDYQYAYIKFYLEDNEFNKFLITLYKYKVLQETISRPSNIGNVTYDEYINNVSLSKISNIYEDTDDTLGRMFMIIEIIDNSYLEGKNAVIDCNDDNGTDFYGDVELNANKSFTLPYIESDLVLNSSNPVKVDEDFINSIS